MSLEYNAVKGGNAKDCFVGRVGEFVGVEDMTALSVPYWLVLKFTTGWVTAVLNCEWCRNGRLLTNLSRLASLVWRGSNNNHSSKWNVIVVSSLIITRRINIMESKRELIAALSIGFILISFFAFMFIVGALRGVVTTIFLWGIPFGFLFGFMTWIYLSKAWDPVNLRPTRSESSKWQSRLLWIAVPGGLILSRLLPRLVGEEITSLIVSCTITWVVLTLGYMMVIVGWHHWR